MKQNTLKNMFYISNFYNSLIFGSIFSLIYKIVVSNVGNAIYMTGNIISLFAYTVTGYLLSVKTTRDLLYKHYYLVILFDVLLYSIVVFYTINKGYETRYLLVSIISATTTTIWISFNTISQQLLWKKESLVNFDTKNNFIGSFGSLIGSIIGIYLSTLNLGYSELCLFQVMAVIILGISDLFILTKARHDVEPLSANVV